MAVFSDRGGYVAMLKEGLIFSSVGVAHRSETSTNSATETPVLLCPYYQIDTSIQQSFTLTSKHTLCELRNGVDL